MRRSHPDPRMEIPISLEIYQQLLLGSSRTKYEKEDWEIAAEAIDAWTRRNMPDALHTPKTSGYQWKQLFLPTGTLLRTVFAGKNHHCLVEGDQILYKEQAVSPSGFVNAAGGIRRNAWRCTWILFPDTQQWALADTLRPRERARPRAARKPAAPLQAAPAPAPAPTVACTTPQERRMPRDDRMTALLRHELLPLLQRICAASGAPPVPRHTSGP